MENKEVTFSQNGLFPNSESQNELIFLLEKKLIEIGVLRISEFKRDLSQIIKELNPLIKDNDYYDYCIS
jgi:hypothetical protein